MKLSAREIVQATDGALVSGFPKAICDGVSIDSRTICPGQLFVPLQGAHCDGHDFIADALQNGAAGFLFRHGQALPTSSAGVAIRVCDTLRALHDLTRYALKKLSAPVIAVAGSNGKTTTKELISYMLAQRFRTCATKENNNTEIGLPLTVLNAPDDTELFVLEMGTTALGDLRTLCQIAPPRIGVLTSIAEEHLATLGSLERVMEAETELLETLPAHGLAIINGDNRELLAIARRKARCRLVTFGCAPHNDFVAEEIRISRTGTHFSLRSPLWQNEVQVSLLGRPAVLAALAATAVAQEFGLSFSEIRRGLLGARSAWGRLQLLSLPDTAITVLHDAYNANPASMREAIVCAAQIRQPDEELIFVLGDMLELGAMSARAHREIGRLLSQFRPDRLIVVGEWARLIGEEAARVGILTEHFATSDDAARALPLTYDGRCFILLKGSRGMRLEKILDALSQRPLVSA